jgi:hypothetical protein
VNGIRICNGACFVGQRPALCILALRQPDKLGLDTCSNSIVAMKQFIVSQMVSLTGVLEWPAQQLAHDLCGRNTMVFKTCMHK